jgi:predicted nucleotidyltransferase
MMSRMPLNRDLVADYCRKWKIVEFSLFGSVLRDDFSSESDVDVLVTFSPGAEWTLFDHMDMQEELAALLGRKADLITRRAVERSKNWILRKAILESAEPLYVAG